MPHVQKKCKIVSAISYQGTIFILEKSDMSTYFFCAETSMLLQTVFITECKVECCLEYLPFFSAKNIE